MPLRVPDISRDDVEVVRSHLSNLAAGRAGAGALQTVPAGVALAAPHHVYSLGLEDLARGAGLDRAVRDTVRFLVMDGETPLASAELHEDGSFQSNEGPFVQATVTAIRRAEDDAEIADRSYELCALRVPALKLMALWLKGADGEGDLVVPMDPAPAPLAADRAYPADELMPRLAEMSDRLLSSMKRPDEEGG